MTGGIGGRSPFQPWAYFLWFLAAGLFLSYGGLTPALWSWVLAGGILLPLAVGWAIPPREAPADPAADLPVPLWAWALTFVLGVFLRFYRLLSLSAWPMPDEGGNAHFATNLAFKGAWHFFYGNRQSPPLFHWILGSFLKVFQPSLFALWSFPALISAMALGALWIAIPRFLSGPRAFAAFFMAATSFWPLYMGRFCFDYGLLYFLACAALAALGLLPRAKAGKPWALGLFVLCLVLGTLTSLLWIVAILALVPVVWGMGGRAPGRRTLLYLLLAGAAGCAGLALLGPHGIEGILSPDPGWGPMDRLRGSLSYAEAIFWKGREHCYGPVWGGLLDPVTGSLFFLGLLGTLRSGPPSFRYGPLFALGVTLLPALASRELETFRILFAFPVLVLFAARGSSFLMSRSGKGRMAVLALILASGASLDAYHLFERYHRAWGEPVDQWYYLKNTVTFRAFQDLRAVRAQRGAGLVLGGLCPLEDTAFDLAVYPFDASRNPACPPENACWASVILPERYRPFLDRSVPGILWYSLGKDHPWDAGEWCMAVLPLEGAMKDRARSWQAADGALRDFDDHLYEWKWEPWRDPSRLAGELAGMKGTLGKDPFLWTCYLERVIYFHRGMGGTPGEVLAAVGGDLGRAYPMPTLSNWKKAAARSRIRSGGQGE